jgi:hypothetical protein
MIEKRLFHSQQHTVLVPISSTVSLFSSFFFFPFLFFILFLQPLVKHRLLFHVRGVLAISKGCQVKTSQVKAIQSRWYM